MSKQNMHLPLWDVSSATSPSHDTSPNKRTPDFAMEALEDQSPCSRPTNNNNGITTTTIIPTKPSCATPTTPACPTTPTKPNCATPTTTPTKPNCATPTTTPTKPNFATPTTTTPTKPNCATPTTTTPTKPNCATPTTKPKCATPNTPTTPTKSNCATPTTTTPTKSSCPPKGEAACSSAAPSRRSRSRKGPVRSLSSPLARSFSARLPSAHRCKSDRFADRLTTYKDDFRSPQDLSYKLQGLNLETSVRTLPETSTTYRDSYRWPSWRKRDAGPPTDSTSQPQKASVDATRDSQMGAPSVAGILKPVTATAHDNHAKNHSKVFSFCDSVQPEKTPPTLVKYFVRRPQCLNSDAFGLTKNDKISPASGTSPSREKTVVTPAGKETSV